MGNRNPVGDAAMSRTHSGIARCPFCDRTVSTDSGRFGRHRHGDGYCRMTDQHVPIVGHTATDYVSRAHLVTDLAAQVQDADPSIAWDYLTALPAAELQRLTMIALAGIPVDQTVSDIFGWVTELPIARASA
jgi:hypothetical protein